MPSSYIIHRITPRATILDTPYNTACLRGLFDSTLRVSFSSVKVLFTSLSLLLCCCYCHEDHDDGVTEIIKQRDLFCYTSAYCRSLDLFSLSPALLMASYHHHTATTILSSSHHYYLSILPTYRISGTVSLFQLSLLG